MICILVREISLSTLSTVNVLFLGWISLYLSTMIYTMSIAMINELVHKFNSIQFNTLFQTQVYEVPLWTKVKNT